MTETDSMKRELDELAVQFKRHEGLYRDEIGRAHV